MQFLRKLLTLTSPRTGHSLIPVRDPNEVLQTARRALSGYLLARSLPGTDDNLENLNQVTQELADCFEQLDTSLSKGGALPDSWSRAR
jgi:hypothetical protein